MNGPPESKRPRLIDSIETHAITTVDNSFEGIQAGDRVAFDCGVVAGLLGVGPFDNSWLSDEAWVTKLHGLAALGVSAAALVRYFKIVATGTVPIEASQGSESGFRVYRLPEVLRNAQAGQKGFTADFIKFAKRFTQPDFLIRTIMDDARRILMANREKYFAHEFCEVVVQIPDLGKVRATVRDAYELVDPSLRSCQGFVISPGSNLTEWVVQVGKGIGRARTKKEARMIAVIRDKVDPNFVPDRTPCKSMIEF